ncbi:MAG TPA: class I SAM-dependent rRNA methyltransferase [Vicinamibacterales bacterium]|nr:class I SAM-dependent rRNA methyltransferase [Vicinamibacterales bacterium]
MNARVVISARGENRVSAGHLWIYRSDVVDVQASGGDVVAVVGSRGRLLGRALFSDRSQIALRLLVHGDQPVDGAFWRRRLETALRFRERLGIDATAYRLVHGEGDLLPSLVVDRYGDWLVLQSLSQGIERALPDITRALVELLAPPGILARNDVKVRLLEGLDQGVGVLHGDVPATIPVREGPVEYEVDPWKGQKTGLFLDQRENRAAASEYARGRLFDGFSYNGGFALRLAPTCDEVVAVDISADAVARIAANARQNGLSNVAAHEANVFDELRRLEREGERFDTVVLDPPAFAKNKASVDKALSGYREINLRALRILSPGGFLVTCSCSYHVDEAAFAQVVYEAAVDAGVHVDVVEKRMQGRDHPVLLGVPESYYLKCFVLRRIE